MLQWALAAIERISTQAPHLRCVGLLALWVGSGCEGLHHQGRQPACFVCGGVATALRSQGGWSQQQVDTTVRFEGHKMWAKGHAPCLNG